MHGLQEEVEAKRGGEARGREQEGVCSAPLNPVFVVGADMSVRPSAAAFATASSAVIGASAGRGRLASALKSFGSPTWPD